MDPAVMSRAPPYVACMGTSMESMTSPQRIRPNRSATAVILKRVAGFTPTSLTPGVDLAVHFAIFF